MSDLYTSLQVSPKKKRYPSDDDDNIIIPKKARIAPPTPITSVRRRPAPTPLPPHLSRLQSIQSSLHHALAHALATSAVSPNPDTGVVPNVLIHLNLTTAAGLKMNCTMDDLKQLCWIWEWDGMRKPNETNAETETENPFLENAKSEHPKQWTRGSMGFIITPTTHLAKGAGKRVPAYGLGIEVELDIDKDMCGGMAAVARWASAAGRRMKELTSKLQRWTQLHSETPVIPPLPFANLPPLTTPALKQSSLTQRLASLSPKSPKSLTASSSAYIQTPPSPSRLSPAKPRVTPQKQKLKDFAVPFPSTPASLPRTKSSIAFPQTPSTKRTDTRAVSASTPQTPSDDASSPARPSTPAHQTGSTAETVPSTPTTSRRAALYERIRKRSESLPVTPSKARVSAAGGMTKDQLLKLGQEEMRRRCLLGRLGGVAEGVWMLFSSPATAAAASPSPRKRRTLPTSEVVQAIVKSSPVPISFAEAYESIGLLTSLCPFFLKSIEVGGEEWLAMPASVGAVNAPPSPGQERSNNEELKALSPRRVRREGGGLREVRERIKKELEAEI